MPTGPLPRVDLPEASGPRPQQQAPSQPRFARGSDHVVRLDPHDPIDEIDPRHLEIGEATQIIARPRAPRRARYAWLISAGAAFAAAGIVTIAAPAPAPPPSTAVLTADAAAIATAIDATAMAARDRITAVAEMPVLRAAVLTDAATVHDLVTSEIQLAPGPGEMLVIDQLRGDQRTTLLHLPATAPPIAPLAAGELRLAPGIDGGLALIVAAPIAPYADDAKVSGAIAIAVPVDLELAVSRLPRHAAEATLTGAGQPITLVARPAGVDGAAPIDVDVHPTSGTSPALHLRVIPPASGAPWKNPLRLACCGLGVAMLLGFAIWRRIG